MRILLLCFFVLLHLKLVAQIPYKIDSTLTLWPNKEKKSYTKSFYSPYKEQTYTYQIHFFENGRIKSKEFVLSSPENDSLIMAKSEWDEKNQLVKKTVYTGNHLYHWNLKTNNILAETYYSSYNNTNYLTSYNPDYIKHFTKHGFVKIPAGKINNHNITYTSCPYIPVNEFFLQETEVTNKQYREFINVMIKDSAEVLGMDYIKYELLPDKNAIKEVTINGEKILFRNYFNDTRYDNYPVTAIDWFASKYYCEWLQQKLGMEYPELKGLITVRLPTEMEWEYAATSGMGMQAYVRDKENILKSSNLNSPSDNFKFTSPVKSFAPNNFGLYDMTGNIKEWCEDAYFDPFLPFDDSLKFYDPLEWNIYRCYYNDEEPRKILRGGSFNDSPDIFDNRLRDFQFQDSTSYFGEQNFTTQREAYEDNYTKKVAHRRTYNLIAPYKKLPPDMGFRVVIELFDPAEIRRYPIDCIWEEF